LKRIRNRGSLDDLSTQVNVIVTTGNVRMREMTTKGAGIGAKVTRGDMKVDATITTRIGIKSGKDGVTIAKKTEIPTETETAIGGLKLRPCLNLRMARELGVDKIGRRKTEIRSRCCRNGVYGYDNEGRPN
jgi:hypothetical protein